MALLLVPLDIHTLYRCCLGQTLLANRSPYSDGSVLCKRQGQHTQQVPYPLSTDLGLHVLQTTV